MSKILQFLQDDTGALSSMRLLFLVWGFGVLAVWLFVSIHTMVLAPLPWTLTSFIVSLVGGKVLQSWTDNTSATLPQPTQPVVAPVATPTPPVVVVAPATSAPSGSVATMP